MAVLQRLRSNKRASYAALALIIIILLVGGYFLLSRDPQPEEAVGAEKKRVEIVKAGDLATESSALRTVGTVRAISEARLQTESSGRVTAVNVAIGDQVRAGTVLASIENSAQRAALTQAQAGYESARAGNAQSSISLAETRVGAENAYRTAFATADDAIRNLASELFSNTDLRDQGGLRISGNGEAPRLNEERAKIDEMLREWNASLSNLNNKDGAELLDTAEKNVTRVNTFISDLARLVALEEPNAEFTEQTLGTYKTRFAATRAALNGTLQSISGARNALLSAQQSSEGGAVSSESAARLKQAMGALEAAQSAYEKTLIRTPISGVVNALYLRANEYVGMSQPAAVVANNGALEVTTSVSEEERPLVAVGNPVSFEINGRTTNGTITRIAPALDPQTGKIEVKVSVDDAEGMENGSAVSLLLQSATTTAAASRDLRIPLQALKITAEGPNVFIVVNGTLEARPVELGSVVGDLVIIQKGIDANTEIVKDARGLKAGDAVDVTAPQA